MKSGMKALTLGAILAGAVLCLSSGPAAATVGPVCSLTGGAAAPLEFLPSGCEYVLVSPVVISGMSGNGGGNTHTITIDSFTITPGPFGVTTGTNQKNIVPPTISPFDLSTPISESDTTTSTNPITLGINDPFNVQSFNISISGTNTKVQLDPSFTSSDTGAITVAGSGGNFQIHSFFDVFVDLTLDGSFTATTPPTLPNFAEGELQFVLVNVPEPASLALLVPGLIGLGWARRQRARSTSA